MTGLSNTLEFTSGSFISSVSTTVSHQGGSKGNHFFFAVLTVSHCMRQHFFYLLLFSSVKYCGSGEVNFQNESCYELLTEEEADANAASGGLVEAETHCANNGYRLPHIGSEAELDFLTSLQQQRYGESKDKCFVYATCAGGTNADGLPQCHWKGWSAATVKYVGKPHWAELKPQTCSTNCDGLCATFEEDKTRFIVCRSDAVYSKPVYCERRKLISCLPCCYNIVGLAV